MARDTARPATTAVTVAPDTTAPDVSDTTPWTATSACCAATGLKSERLKRKTLNSTERNDSRMTVASPGKSMDDAWGRSPGLEDAEQTLRPASPSPARAEWYSMRDVLPYSGGTAPVLHRTSLLSPTWAPEAITVISRRQIGRVDHPCPAPRAPRPTRGTPEAGRPGRWWAAHLLTGRQEGGHSSVQRRQDSWPGEAPCALPAQAAREARARPRQR